MTRQIPQSGANRPDVRWSCRSRLDASNAPVPSQPEGKKLIVGRDISLNGQITSCEKLIVEGHVRAELNECREMEITKTGYFKGNAEIENAEVSGHFEGSMIVGDRLFIRATGRVEGDIRYGRLEVECGGKLYGQIMDTDQTEL